MKICFKCMFNFVLLLWYGMICDDGLGMSGLSSHWDTEISEALEEFPSVFFSVESLTWEAGDFALHLILFMRNNWDLVCVCFSPQTFNSTQYPTCPSARCVFINYNEEGLFQKNLFNLQIYNVVAFLWCVNFVIALGHCTLAGAFGSYYWAFSKPADIPTFPLIQSFMRALR